MGHLHLPDPAHIIARVVSESGEPLDFLRVELRRVGTTRLSISGRFFRFDRHQKAWVGSPLHPGHYEVAARTLGLACQVERVRLAAGETKRIEIRSAVGVPQRFTITLRANPVMARHPRASKTGRVEFRITDAKGRLVLDQRIEKPWTDRARRIVNYEIRLVPGKYTARLGDHWGDAYPGNGRVVEFEVPATGKGPAIRVEFQ